MTEHKHEFKYQRLEQGWLCHCGEYYRKITDGTWKLVHKGEFAEALGNALTDKS